MHGNPRGHLFAADLVKRKKISGWLACSDAMKIMGGEHHFEWAATVDGKHATGRTAPECPEFIDAIKMAITQK